jgi:hypothetical protein
LSHMESRQGFIRNAGKQECHDTDTWRDINEGCLKYALGRICDLPFNMYSEMEVSHENPR